MRPLTGMGARICAAFALAMSLTIGAGRREPKIPQDPFAPQDLSLWIDERQVRMFSGKMKTFKESFLN